MSFYLDGTYSNTDFITVKETLNKISSKVTSVWLEYAVARLLDYQKINPNMQQWFHARGVILTSIYQNRGYRSGMVAKMIGDAGGENFLIYATGLDNNINIVLDPTFSNNYNQLLKICEHYSFYDTFN